VVTASSHFAATEPHRQNGPDPVSRATLLAEAFAERAAVHDRDGSFPFGNFEDLSKAGLLALTVPAALGGGGAGAAEVARISASSARPIHRLRWCCRCTTYSTS
jgi:alkylation response protein AidB-like acyl-CoA dehydrogenase